MKSVVWGDVNRVNPGTGVGSKGGLNHINQSVCVLAHNSWSKIMTVCVIKTHWPPTQPLCVCVCVCLCTFCLDSSLSRSLLQKNKRSVCRPHRGKTCLLSTVSSLTGERVNAVFSTDGEENPHNVARGDRQWAYGLLIRFTVAYVVYRNLPLSARPCSWRHLWNMALFACWLSFSFLSPRFKSILVFMHREL